CQPLRIRRQPPAATSWHTGAVTASPRRLLSAAILADGTRRGGHAQERALRDLQRRAAYRWPRRRLLLPLPRAQSCHADGPSVRVLRGCAQGASAGTLAKLGRCAPTPVGHSHHTHPGILRRAAARRAAGGTRHTAIVAARSPPRGGLVPPDRWRANR